MWLNAANATSIEIDQAQALVTIQGSSELSLVQLPYHWDRLNPGQAGEAMFEVAFDLPGEPSEPYGVYFPRVGNRFEVWLNGTVLTRNGDMLQANGADFSKGPRYIAIPPQLLQKTNLFRLQIKTDVGRRGGLSPVHVGPESDMRALYNKAFRWRVAGALAVAIFSLLVGVMALSLWFTQRDTALYPNSPQASLREPIYLLAGIAELAWALRVSDSVIEQPPLAWPWWGIVVGTAYAAWIACMTSFCQHIIGVENKLSNRVLTAVFISGFACSAGSFFLHQPLIWNIWLGLAVAGFGLYGCWYIYSALHVRERRDKVRILVAFAVLVNIVAGARDWVVVRMGIDSYGETSWVRYTSVLFGLCLAYIVITRFRLASAQARQLMHSLAERVAQKESELAVSYQKLELLAREQERTFERTRILRDMHDGVGSHISAAIRQLQSGKASNGQVLVTLRDSLDQLKLSIDSMHLPIGDVTALMANMRYRLEPRFTSSGISFVWDVDVLPHIARLDHSAMRQLQYMVFEVLSNVLQHAQANELRIEAHCHADHAVVLRIMDNGHGFDVATATSRGLASMRERAVAIGAGLHISSGAAGTCVEITLG